MRCWRGGGVLHGVGQLVSVEQELGEQGHLGERVGGVDVADQFVPEVEVGEAGQPPQHAPLHDLQLVALQAQVGSSHSETLRVWRASHSEAR